MSQGGEFDIPTELTRDGELTLSCTATVSGDSPRSRAGPAGDALAAAGRGKFQFCGLSSTGSPGVDKERRRGRLVVAADAQAVAVGGAVDLDWHARQCSGPGRRGAGEWDGFGSVTGRLGLNSRTRCVKPSGDTQAWRC